MQQPTPLFVLVFYYSPQMGVLEMSDAVWAVLKTTLGGSSEFLLITGCYSDNM